MRKNRVKLIDRDGHYHCMSRVVNNHFLFKDPITKEAFVALLKKTTAFSGVQLLNYAIMDNHYHVFIKVPKRPKKEMSDKELFQKIETFYGKKHPTTLRARMVLLAEIDESDPDTKEQALWEKEELRNSYFQRMYDLSECMKTFNQHTAKWCEKHLDWVGAVWRDRFKSTLVQNDPYLKMLVSAYIDLNAVRANMVTDPKEYKYCGYTEALLGDEQMQKNLQEIFGKESWKECQEEYRVFLAQRMKAKFKPNQTKADKERVIQFANEVEAKHGELTMGELLRLQFKHLMNARVLGDAAFVAEVRGMGSGVGNWVRKKGQRGIAALLSVGGNVVHADVVSQGGVR